VNKRVLLGVAVTLVYVTACGGGRDAAGGDRCNGGTKPREGETSVSTPVGSVHEFVVFVDSLNLRAEPSAEAAVVTRLSRGTRLTNRSEVAVEAEGRFWRQVEADGRTGWVADEYILPALFYDAFAKADELGRSGDGEGMINATLEGLREVGSLQGKEAYCYRLSPDRRKVLVTLEYGEPPDWHRGYPGPGYDFQPVPVLYFVNGEGLAKYLFYEAFIPGEWSADSRYYVCAEPYWIELLDTEEWSRISLGERNYSEGVPDFEISGKYVVWLSWEEPRGPIPEPFDESLSVPVLLAYDLDTGDVARLLEADFTTLNNEVHGRDFGYDYHEIKMVETGLCPRDLKASYLFNRFNDVFDLARVSYA
jgi:hypothetical protein